MTNILQALLIFLGVTGVGTTLLLALTSFIIWRSGSDMETFKDE